MKSAAKKAELADEEQQHGSPLPRGRRVSVKSPEAIRMEVEEGEDEMKRDLVMEIVRTPGVALRSTSRRARLTPAPLPTPVPASSARATMMRAPAGAEGGGGGADPRHPAEEPEDRGSEGCGTRGGGATRQRCVHGKENDEVHEIQDDVGFRPGRGGGGSRI